MAHLAIFLADIARACAAADFPKAREHDTTDFETTLLKETLGDLLPLLLPMLGLQKLETRADLDALASHLIGLGL